MKLPRGRVHHGTHWQFSLLPKALSFRQQRQPVRHRSVAETRRIDRRTEAHHPFERWTVGPCRTWHLETQRRGWPDRFRRWKMGAPVRDGGTPLISLFTSPPERVGVVHRPPVSTYMAIYGVSSDHDATFRARDRSPFGMQFPLVLEFLAEKRRLPRRRIFDGYLLA